MPPHCLATTQRNTEGVPFFSTYPLCCQCSHLPLRPELPFQTPLFQQLPDKICSKSSKTAHRFNNYWNTVSACILYKQIHNTNIGNPDAFQKVTQLSWVFFFQGEKKKSSCLLKSIFGVTFTWMIENHHRNRNVGRHWKKVFGD